MTSIVDLRRDFFGGSIDAEREAIQSALDAGITFADMAEQATPYTPGILVGEAGLSSTAQTWLAANQAVFRRLNIRAKSLVRYIEWECVAQADNVEVGLVQLSGADHLTYTLIASTGVIACPAVGTVRSDIGAQTIDRGDYAIFMWCSGTTFQTRQPGASSIVTSMKLAANKTGLATGVAGTPTAALTGWYSRPVSMGLAGNYA